MEELPETIRDVETLEELLSRPPDSVIQMMGRLEGGVLVLGAGGKMGPTLATMACRAVEASGVERRVVAVSRFSDAAVRERLKRCHVETIRCDLLDRTQLAALPDAKNVIYMAGRKFGSTGQESLTWAMNAYLPGMVCEKYRNSRIVVFSTGNVYPMVSVESSGSREGDATAPCGEYAMSCLGRERVFSHFSEIAGIPVALIRLNYANEMRYGTLVDVAQHVLADQPIDVTMGYFNAIWQGDANAMALLALERADSPAWIVNVAGPDKLSVRDVARQYGQLVQKAVRFIGQEAPDAFLSDARQAYARLGATTIGPDQMMRWIVDWLQRGGLTWNKPTHFQTRDGKF